jgi:hypothetical protein
MTHFRFSLKWLMIALTAACILLFLTVTFGDFVEVAFFSAIWCIVPTPLIIFAIYGRGDLQAAAIGALVPYATLMILRVPTAWSSYFNATLWLLPMSALCGVLAAATRRWMQGNERGRSE